MENYTVPKCWGTDHKHGAALWDARQLFPAVYESNDLKLLRAALQKRAYDLEKRERELNCLYGISEIVGQPDISMKEMLGRIVRLIPSALTYPQITCIRLTVGDQIFQTENFRKTDWIQLRKILVNESDFAHMEIAYLEERPEADEGPFLNEEIILFDAIAKWLGRIIERRQSKEKLIRLNRSLKMLGYCNKALIHATDESEFMEDICRLIVEEGKYRLAWVGFAEEKDEEKIIRPVAQWGYEDGYLKNLNISWDDSTRGRGPTGTAIRTRKICVVQHILTDPGYRSWRAEALRQGYAASVAIPLFINEACTGVLHIYSAEPGAFDQDEVELLTEFAGDLSYGINVLRTRAERNRSQEALRESERRYKTLFDNAGDAIFVHDFEGQFLNVNGPACERLGYRREELLKMNVTDIHLPDEAERIPMRIAEVRSRGHMVFETTHIRRDGEKIPVETCTRAVPYDGETAMLNFARDISERRRAEKEKNELRAQIRQAQKMEAIGTLAGGIAHDFNNILFPIIGYAELGMEKVSEGSSLSKNFEQILKAANRASDLIQQILTFSRKTEHKRRPVKIHPIIKEAAKFLRASLPGSITIRHKIASDMLAVLADPVQIHQIVMNLCTNAYHAMRNEGGILEISLSEADPPPDIPETDPARTSGRYLKLTVQDTGHGINPAVMERIFDPYFTTKISGEGTGLGLSVVSGIVKEYGGHISVKSQIGKGSTFCVWLPCIDTESAKETVSAAPPVLGGNERILVVDDEKPIRDIISEMLSSLGYHVTAKTDSLEALEIFRDRPGDFDMVITDLNMPNLMGIQLSEELMKIRPDIPLILCTGFSEAVAEDKAKAIGIRELIMKPVIKRKLAETVRRGLNKKSN